MSLHVSGLPGTATSINAAYEIRKKRERQDISDYHLVVHGQPPSQPQSGEGEYEVPGPPNQFLPPAVAPSQDREGTWEELVYESV